VDLLKAGLRLLLEELLGIFKFFWMVKISSRISEILAVGDITSDQYFQKFQLFLKSLIFYHKNQISSISTSISLLPAISDCVPSANQYTKLLNSQYYKFSQLTFLHRCFSLLFFLRAHEVKSV
jgi:hypothetical protein